jgi:hypothetical protein
MNWVLRESFNRETINTYIIVVGKLHEKRLFRRLRIGFEVGKSVLKKTGTGSKWLRIGSNGMTVAYHHFAYQPAEYKVFNIPKCLTVLNEELLEHRPHCGFQ